MESTEALWNGYNIDNILIFISYKFYFGSPINLLFFKASLNMSGFFFGLFMNISEQKRKKIILKFNSVDF